MSTDHSTTAPTPLMRKDRRSELVGAAWRLLGRLGWWCCSSWGSGPSPFWGDSTRTSKRVSGNGTQVVRVALVDAVVGFDVTPDVLEVVRGTHVVLNVVNEGGEGHDLAVDGGAKTRTLSPGQSQRLDLGTVAGDWAAWCTLPGHKLAGMTLDIQIVERPATSEPEAM